MQTAYKILLLPFALMILFTQCEKDSEIDLVDIPDNAFLDALIEEGVDTNGDGKICACEAARVSCLDVSYLNITDMNGIDAFINLDTLDCSGNLLNTLDVAICSYGIPLLWQRMSEVITQDNPPFVQKGSAVCLLD